MRKWIRGWNPRGKDGTGRGWSARGKDGTGRGWNPRGKGGKVLAAIFGEFAWHSVIDGIGAFF